ncbi:divergent PAP2 family protein [Aquibacillus koreensis]|uniref:Divergent PAP2 family protein n=1 Tax=Aquibacillus koreensis TaxID=279446 RepID=A0A9X3WR93_9BACI|nr:divergent PAP2 family protein [Aquibacillus koreensis]MCT2536920.1 divergent PAP2 family protein [Aquibacillus koreensis]MDC3421949.1 divergent PAP2 family protein [Aquibacillus koreensis]
MNRALTTALIGIGTAQFLKVPTHYIETGKWDWRKLIGSGDMPSSHSSAVTSLTTYVALKKGIPSIHFGVSSIFGLIVMYDAMGIRWQTGQIAIAVNDMDEQLEKLSVDHPNINHKKRDRELKEMLGHLPIEVAGGAALGIAIGAISYLIEKKTKNNI